MREFGKRVRRLTILVSTRMEPNRDWDGMASDLDIRVQKSWMLTHQWRHDSGFREDNYVHVPRDTTRQLRALRPDVILSYEMGVRTVFASMYRRRRPECRLVMVCNISDVTERGRGRLRHWLRRRLRRRVDLVTSNGPGCTRYLKSIGYDASRILPYHYCHDAAKVFSGARAFSAPPSRLFYCGSLSERKGILPFCEALATWCRRHPHRQVELVLAGDGPLRAAIESMDRPANLRFTLRGSVDADTIRQDYGHADLTVFPTLADEWGLVTNESLASGTPMLTSVRAQSTEVLCRDGVNAWLFDPLQQGSMENALETAMAAPPDALARMSDAARRSVENINVRSSGDEFARIVRTALELPGVTPGHRRDKFASLPAADPHRLTARPTP
jgi:glycosyltransferase involved in cell wall biosynthesis